MQKEDWDRALADFNEVLRRDPKNASAYNRRGFVHLEKLAFDKAIADFDQAIRLNPKSEHNYNNRGLALLQKGDVERAIVDLNQALAINPKAVSALNNRGLAYGLKGKHDLAILDYDDAIRIDPRSYESFTNRGIAYREKGDFDRALADLEHAAAIDPRGGKPSFHRGFIWRAKGELDRAIAEFNDAIERAARCRGCPRVSRPRLRRKGRLRAGTRRLSSRDRRTGEICPHPALAGDGARPLGALVGRQPAHPRARNQGSRSHAGHQGGRIAERPPHRVGDRQCRLCGRLRARQSGQRCARRRGGTAPHRLHRVGRHRPRPRRHAAPAGRFPARCRHRQGRAPVLRRPRHADRRPQLSGAGRRLACDAAPIPPPT